MWGLSVWRQLLPRHFHWINSPVWWLNLLWTLLWRHRMVSAKFHLAEWRHNFLHTNFRVLTTSLTRLLLQHSHPLRWWLLCCSQWALFSWLGFVLDFTLLEHWGAVKHLPVGWAACLSARIVALADQLIVLRVRLVSCHVILWEFNLTVTHIGREVLFHCWTGSPRRRSLFMDRFRHFCLNDIVCPLTHWPDRLIMLLVIAGDRNLLMVLTFPLFFNTHLVLKLYLFSNEHSDSLGLFLDIKFLWAWRLTLFELVTNFIVYTLFYRRKINSVSGGKTFWLDLALNYNLDLLSQLENWLLRANTWGWSFRNHLVKHSILRLFSSKHRIIKWVLLSPGNLLITRHLKWEQIVTLFGSWWRRNVHDRGYINFLL